MRLNHNVGVPHCIRAAHVGVHNFFSLNMEALMSDSDTKLILSSIGGFSQRIADLCVALNTVVEKITPTNSARDAIVAHVNEFCNTCDLTEIQLITMHNFSSWVQQQRP